MNRRAELDSLIPERDNEGYLLNPGDWTRALAPLLAAEDGLMLSPAHWQVIDFIRAWYGDTESVPEARRAIQHWLNRAETSVPPNRPCTTCFRMVTASRPAESPACASR